jgi:hypothetical protein
MSRYLKLTAVVVVMAAIAVGSFAFAAKPTQPGPGKCPRDVYCLDVWDPVLCADDQIYSNMCYAFRECAPMPCVSLNDPPILKL